MTLFREGDRVRYKTSGPYEKYRDQQGAVLSSNDVDMVVVRFDDFNIGRRVINMCNLKKENVIVNIKLNVKTAIDALFPKVGTGLNALARELLVATSAASAADARKKKAKDAAIAGGLVLAEYRPGEVTSFDDKEFVVVAKTNEPTSKLDQSRLRELLNQAGLSRAKIDAAFVGATTENKPATSYVVTQK